MGGHDLGREVRMLGDRHIPVPVRPVQTMHIALLIHD